MTLGEGFLDVREHRRRHVRSFELPGESGSVKVARDEVAGALRRAGWPAHSVDRARLVASELVTNAVIHAGSTLAVTVRVDEDVAWIEVADDAPGSMPRLAAPTDPRPGGLGLYLVDAMSGDWGVDRDGTRKVVWARLSCADLDGDG